MVKEKFWKVEEAVVEVAKNLPDPMIGDSKPEAKVEVAVEVETSAPTVNGLKERALKSVTVEPSATAPPPPSPEPAVTVTEELARLVLVITPAVERDPMESAPERERLLPCPAVKLKFCKLLEAVVEVAKNLPEPIIGDSSPAAKVEVAVEVATNAPAVNGLYERPAAAAGHVVLQASPVRQMVVAERAFAESEVPCPLVKEKF